MSEELKPCPFCGEPARYDWIEAGCAVKCHSCDVSVMRGGVGVGWYATEAEAAADWNRRAQPAEAEGVAVVGFLYKNDGGALTAANMDSDTFALMARSDFDGEVEKLVRQSDHLATLSAVTAERDQLRAKVDQLTRESEGIAERAKHYAGQLGKALGEMETLRKDAELYRRLRDLPDDQVGTAGVPCVAVPRGPFSGTYVSGAELDAAMAAKESTHEE